MATSDSDENERGAFLRFARKAALMLPVLLLAPAVNYIVDPANLFEKEGEQETKITEALLSGKNVVNFDRYDDRKIGTYLLSRRTDHPNVMVLGSSRTLNIHGDLFPQSRFVNGSMLGSTIREVLASYAIVHRGKIHPDTVIVGIDPWMVNADAYDSRWIAVKSDFNAALTMIGAKSWPSPRSQQENESRWGALFSADYFQQSIRSLWNRAEKPRWYISDSTNNIGFTRLPEGSYTTSQVQRTNNQLAVDALAEKYAGDGIYMLNANARVDSTLLFAVTQLLHVIRQDGSVPILYLPPYHPIVYARITSDPTHQLVGEAEVALREAAARTGVRVVGSYDPAALGLSGADFYDGHHLRESGLAKALAALDGPTAQLR